MDSQPSQRPSQFPEARTPRQEPLLTRTKRALRGVWPFIVLAILQTVVAIGSLQLLNGMRAFSTGESQWSKGQKDATFALSRYVNTGNESAYNDYLAALNVPMSDMQARELMEVNGEDTHQQASQLLLQGRNAAEEIDGLIWLVTHFKNTSAIRGPLEKWRASDVPLAELKTLATSIHESMGRNPPDSAQQRDWHDRIHALQGRLSVLEQEFNTALGQAARGLSTYLWWINMSGALGMLALLMWHTRRLQRNAEQAEDALDVVSERATTTLAAIGDAVVTTNEAGDILYMNRSAEKLLGASLDQLFMHSLPQLLRAPPVDAGVTLVQDAIMDALAGNAPGAETIYTIYDRHRRARQIKLAYSPIGAQTGNTEAVFVLHDVSQEQVFMRELAWQATHDQLTGLANRYEFERRLENVINQPPDADGCRGAMLYLDLDQFKVINDTCGHPAGDAMLRAISTMLQHGLRADDTLARVGGDEFAILLEHCPFPVALDLAEQLRDAAQRLRVQWGERSLSSSISIGLVKLAPQLTTVEEVFRVADMASYGAKERGRNNTYAYDPSVDKEIARYAGEMEWIERIKVALENDSFILHAQPIHALRPEIEALNGHGLHLEVQLRMRMADGSLISPINFIPAAERYGMMPAVDRWVVNKSLETLARMKQQPQLPQVSLCAINLSGTSLGDEKLLDFLRNQLERHGIDPHTVCFEITETAAITHLPNAIRLVKALKAIGCKFSLDDFGAGMSSFASLKNLPVDFLKIDGAIVADMIREPAHRAMVEAINHLGHALGMQTIAEFAATPEVVEILREMGVDHAQGYATGAPRPFSLPDVVHGATPAEGDSSHAQAT